MTATPGPWHAIPVGEDDPRWLIQPRSESSTFAIAITVATNDEANAKLIAAAPSLADALEAVHQKHEGSHADDEYCEEWCELFKTIAYPALRAAGRLP